MSKKLYERKESSLGGTFKLCFLLQLTKSGPIFGQWVLTSTYVLAHYSMDEIHVAFLQITLSKKCSRIKHCCSNMIQVGVTKTNSDR